MKNKKVLIVLASLIVIVALFFIGKNLYQGEEVKRVSELSERDVTLFTPEHAPKLGPADAKVQLVEFLDPECESCRAFYPFVKQLLAQYPGQIRLTVRYAPFHGNSVFVIKVLEAARKQGRYWETLETLFRHQPEWGSHHHPRPDLVWTFLGEVDVDIEKIRQDMNDPEIDKIIEQDMKDGAQLGVRATPTFFVNGKPLESFGQYQLESAIKNALAE